MLSGSPEGGQGETEPLGNSKLETVSGKRKEVARADKTNGQRELKPLPDTLSGSLVLGVSFGVTPGRKTWPKDSGPCQQGHV